jgi:hypothetical protein
MSHDMALPYSDEQNKTPDKHCLIVPLDVAYDSCRDSVKRQGITDKDLFSFDEFNTVLEKNNIVIIVRFEKAWSKARKEGQYPVNSSNEIKSLADSLDVSNLSIVNDKTDGEIIKGKTGFIRCLDSGSSSATDERSEGLSMTIEADSKRKWSALKTKFSYMTLASTREDKNFLGDVKSYIGVFNLDRMPTSDEAKVIRTELGLKKRPNLSTEDREARKEQLSLNVQKAPSEKVAEIA